MSSYETIEVEPGRVTTIRLNRPERLNAISRQMMDDVGRALAAARADDEVRVVVLSGAGRAFSSGYEIADDEGWWEGMSAADTAEDLERCYLDFERLIWDFPKPTVASVHGYALAGACEIAMLCDITVAAEGTKFGEPEIRLAAGPPAIIMPWVVGMKAAKELLYTGKMIDADRALQIGMVNEVCPADDLDRRTRYHADMLATIAPVAVRLQKEAINRTYELMGLTSSFHLNAKIQGILDATVTEEQLEFQKLRKAEGLRAALNWRDAQFRAIEERG